MSKRERKGSSALNTFAQQLSGKDFRTKCRFPIVPLRPAHGNARGWLGASSGRLLIGNLSENTASIRLNGYTLLPSSAEDRGYAGEQ